jgi:imelysin family protein
LPAKKLGQAYRKATGTGTAEDAADYIESPYSKRSFQDYQDNIYSIKNSLYGVRGTENVTTPANNSVMKFLQKSNYPKYAELNNALNDAINALQTAKTSGVAFIDNPGHAQVKTCIEKVDALNEALNEAGKWVSGLAD